ncbi:hypothetical protein MIND_01368800 [Mycena indigotica]|uniref:Uncharacterized protein n=1 Tax=Mycena indigotica TaxID=2126181 RepID=A0A8H6VQ40_9AGAR|nr:uncharacterized protein MIND_01368800 [Mycena indigotica]KAF7289937.1 hypothetical protein MIND_01368800 [Mycena indigotica]
MLSSSYAEWHTRATPYPNSSSFQPTRADLAVLVLRNSPVEPEGFTLAFFDSSEGQVAVDALGTILSVPREDFSGITELATRVSTELPPTERFRNTWVIDHPTTSQPIDRLLVSVDGKLVETSVQGFNKNKRALQIPIGDVTELPDILQETVGLVLEARDGYSRDKVDKTVVDKVKEIIGDEVVL